MTTGTRTNPKTGMKETYELPPPVDLARSRKELRDMIHGNTQWHVDPGSPPPTQPAQPADSDQDQDWIGVYGY
ncbi:MAG TPA: hypothetical protein P5305_04000 [Rubrivivax sp.]|nr:hypothetical protein [Rubrivivax sp.]HRY87025.1 hypothetical protein [Rubrivivax sp.]